MALFFQKRFPSPALETATARRRRAPLLGLVAFVLLLGLPGGASAQPAQPGLCAACTQFPNNCCARRSSVAACIKCGAGRYDLNVQTQWCQANQPVCAAKR
jgi:hypothetical protein